MSMPSAVCVASCAATSRSLASNGMRSVPRTKTAAPMTRRRPRSGARIARCPVGTDRPGPSSSGSAARAAAESPNTGRTPRSTSASAPPARTSHSSAAGIRSACGSRISGRSRSVSEPVASAPSSSLTRSRSLRRSRRTNGLTGRSSPTGSGSRR
ncbi:hypothetical protein [Streptomyces globisporus]|uniref:hypothetical protein n=1 Tax=Streptomyces globisporus TaxID=1908 RepID=UPI0036F6BFDE